MKHLLLTTIAAVVLVGCSKPPPPDISIHTAAYKGNIEAVKQHLDAGADVNAKGYRERTPLHYAAHGGRNKIVKLLIEEGADVNAKAKDGSTPLDLAIEFKNLGNDPHAAVGRGYTETAVLLRKHGGKTAEELK